MCLIFSAKLRCLCRGISGKQVLSIRVLYILFLRQLERFSKGTSQSPCIDRNHLNRYQDEMVAIYKEISDRTTRFKTNDDLNKTIEKLWRKPSNEISHINIFFDETFDREMLGGKHYTIEKMPESPDDDLYAIGLDKDDFDLGFYSVDTLRIP